MKRFLLGSASAAAVILGLAGSANAQLVNIGDISDAIGDLAPTLGSIDVDVDALNGVVRLPAGVNGAYLNTAINVAPQVNANVQVGVPSVTAAGVGAILGDLAAAGATGPLTGSAAIAVDPTALVSALGTSIDTDNITQTAVGLLVNQGNQNAATTISTVVDNSTSVVNGGTILSYAESTSAAAQAGTAASNAAASVSGSLSTGAITRNLNDIDTTSISGALAGVYASNLAANVAPQINANVQLASDIITSNIAQTGVGVLANQVNSIGLDGTALAGSITGNSTPTAATPAAGNAN